MFCKSLTSYSRRKTNVVNVGGVTMGGSNPIRLQSMTNTKTDDIDATVEQCVRIAASGADYVRCTTQGEREAEAMKEIRAKLNARGVNIPLIADVHFNPHVAEIAACNIEKVRINPGNYIDKRTGAAILTNDEYNAEVKRLEDKFINLLNICKQHKTALRIGVNHGSLSERIMNKYGDTPAGMVESAMEFLRVCCRQNFKDVVVSMKSSNTRVMVQAYRLMAERMNEEKMFFPLHLGVTEAGEGEDGRIKSAVGIGTLLADGLGDTVRVSLTEKPENEVPVAKILVNYFDNRLKQKTIPDVDAKNYSPYEYKKRKTKAVDGIGGDNQVAVVADISGSNPYYIKDLQKIGFAKNANNDIERTDVAPDFVFAGSSMPASEMHGVNVISDESDNIIRCNISYFNAEFFKWLKANKNKIIMLESNNTNAVAEMRACFLMLENANVQNPVIIYREYDDSDIEQFQIKAACDFGALLIDGFGDGICLKANIDTAKLVEISFAILQAARVRFSKTEYIACPSCGRTLYDIQKTLAKIKAKTSHLKHLKIAVMGCIVNGIGEMADADYGYVGAGVGKISLYKNKQIVKRNIPQEQAVDELVNLIKESGDWEN